MMRLVLTVSGEMCSSSAILRLLLPWLDKRKTSNARVLNCRFRSAGRFVSCPILSQAAPVTR